MKNKVDVEKILLLNLQGKNIIEIAKELNCAKSTVSYHLKRNHLSTIVRVLSEKEKEALQECYDECKSVYKVAEIFNIHRATVCKYVKTNRTFKTENELKENRKKAVIDWRVKVKQKLVAYKGGCCERCGYNKNIKALHFHHLDPKQKDFQISGMSLSYERLVQEVDKCQMLCSNCHVEVHDELFIAKSS